MTSDPILSTRSLLHALAGAIVARPHDLRVECQRAEDGSVYWMMQGAPEDEAKLIGAAASHVKALQRLVAEFGSARGLTFTFRVITTRSPGAPAPRQHRDVIEHDPEPARLLLARTLDALGIERFDVEVGAGAGQRRSLTFLFTVRTSRYIEPDTLEAVATMFRAAAKREGVRYQINLAAP